MKWIRAADLDRWADTVTARTALSELISSLVRASAPNPKSFRFPTGDSAQIPGYDGTLESEGTPPWVPDGRSVWEFSTKKDVENKAESDFNARTTNPRGLVPGDTTFIFVTPRTWPDADKWCRAKNAIAIWKDVRVIDGVDLEDWLERNPAVAARMARGLLPVMPSHGVRSVDEFWDEYASRFQPTLSEAVLLAGRADQAEFLLQQLQTIAYAHLWQADSLEEVLGFSIAAIRKSDAEVRKYLEAKTLVIETREAAQQLAYRTDLIFLLRAGALELSGLLGKRGPTIVPIGRDQPSRGTANTLKRPHFDELADSLRTMGLTDKRAEQLARACGRSVTILARRIPSATSTVPSWSTHRELIPALLAGGWSTRSQEDLEAVQQLAKKTSYGDYEADLLPYLRADDPPLDREGDVWRVRAPVDAFVHLGTLVAEPDLKTFEAVVNRVFGEIDPSLELPPEERFYAGLSGKKLKHSEWLRDGLAATLLLIAEFHEEAGLHTPGMSPQEFVNQIVAKLPGLDSDYRTIASLYGVLPMLAEAAPRSLLQALDRLIGGDGQKIQPIFQDKQIDSFHSSSPHTALLWALELLAWDPLYLAEATIILAKLARLDPGGKLANRPINSLREIFLVWHPSTNATMEQRFSALDQIIRLEPDIGWNLLIMLLPEFHSVASSTAKPRYREASASTAEMVSYGTVGKAYKQIVDRVLAQVGDDPAKWITVIRQMGSFSPPDRGRCIELLEKFASKQAGTQTEVWSALRAEVSRHRRFQSAEWAMKDADLRRFEAIVKQLEPTDALVQIAWLFNDYHPDLPETDKGDDLERVQAKRRDAIRKLYQDKGMNGVRELASNVKLPAYVAYAFVEVTELDDIEKMIDISLQKNTSPNVFEIALSAGADSKFKDEWRRRLEHCWHVGTWSAQQVGRLMLDWHDDLPTWRLVESLGQDVERVYWDQKVSRPVKGDVGGLDYVVGKYLAHGRALAALDTVAYTGSSLSADTLFRVLDASIVEINASPSTLSIDLSYDVEQILNTLRDMQDVPRLEIAKREYAYLPLLGFRQAHLTIHSLLVQDADLFVALLCDVFKPSSGEEGEITEERRARATAGYRLISECHTIPGLTDGEIDRNQLTGWIARVRELAATHDRAAIADEYIGHILAHAPHDADGAWPHRVVRDVIENLASPTVESGIRIERFNMRGTTVRGPFEGGGQERALAARIREWSKTVVNWPRTSRLLEEMAKEWESWAEAQDLRARQDEMRFS